MHELDPADTDRMLKLRNKIFDNITREHWDAMGCIAVVAKHKDKYYGAIPLQYREFMINRRVSIPVVFENAVGVDEGMRGRGIGSAMIECAADLIKDRAYALCVYRGDERSEGYRFYRKTHHSDLYYVSLLKLRAKCQTEGLSEYSPNVEVYSWDKAIELEAQLLPLFRACYGNFGGYWKREKGFFKRIIKSHVYKNESCRLLLVRKKEQIVGYAITNADDYMDYYIYDIAAEESRFLKKLVSKIAFMARKNEQDPVMISNREHPYYRKFLSYGFVPEYNTPYIMARIIRPDHIFARLAGDTSIRRELGLVAVTPHRDLVLNRPQKAKYSATLFLKESQLCRLICCRLDLRNAIETNQIRISPLPNSLEQMLYSIFRFSPWASFRMDYV